MLTSKYSVKKFHGYSNAVFKFARDRRMFDMLDWEYVVKTFNEVFGSSGPYKKFFRRSRMKFSPALWFKNKFRRSKPFATCVGLLLGTSVPFILIGLMNGILFIINNFSPLGVITTVCAIIGAVVVALNHPS